MPTDQHSHATVVHLRRAGLRRAARIVVDMHDHAASYDVPNMDAHARAMTALAMWEAITGADGDHAITLARKVADS